MNGYAGPFNVNDHHSKSSLIGTSLLRQLFLFGLALLLLVSTCEPETTELCVSAESPSNLPPEACG